MKNALTSAILATSLVLGTAAASFASDDNYSLKPAKAEEIRAKLVSDGYEVRKIDMEDGMYEVYAIKDGKRMELYLDKNLQITRTKMDD